MRDELRLWSGAWCDVPRTVATLLVMWSGLAAAEGQVPQAVARRAHPYPPAAREEVVDDYHGQRVAGPYRWLETPDDARTRVCFDAEY